MKQTILTILLALCVFAGTSTTAHAETVINSIPLTLEAIADGEITVSYPKTGMQYTKNGGAKTAVTTDPISVSAKDVVAFYGDGTNIATYFRTYGTQIQCSADCYIYGNIMSLVDEYGFATNTTLTKDYTFIHLFLNNTHIKNHNEKELVLPATVLTPSCYREMFRGCTGLTKAPELPATTLTPRCYCWMFSGCTNLNYVKCLATNISADGCTESWLKGVATTGTFAMISNTAWTTGVSGIPSGWTVKGLDYLLPLTLEAIADGEITVSNPKSGMQYSVNGGAKTAVTTDPISVSTNDVVAFYGNGKEITTYDGTNIQCSANCYIYGNIMSLVDEDGFATNKTLTGEYAFFKLFYTNTHLKSHSDKELVLPATTLTKGCYYNMFCGCTSLKKVPALPATTLADECYACMFYNCTGLKKAPALPATTLTKGCYKSMFFACTGLTTAPALPATTLADDCYSTMFSRCTNLNYVLCLATDISAKYCNLWLSDVAQTGTFVKIANTAWTTGVSGIPDGWTVIDYNYILPLTLEAIADGEITVSNPKSGMQYSVNGGAKTAVTTNPISVSTNDVVAFYGNGKKITMYDDTQIQCSADCYIYGNIMSLVDETGFVTNTTLTREYAFASLFENNTHLKNHSDKELVLPATTLTKGCYYEMFNGCTSLTTAPALPATTLAKGCYASMFNGCTGLTTAPELPATVLKDGCYDHMFSGCTNLNYVLCLATDISAEYYTTQWLNDVAQTGTFVKIANTVWTTGESGIPDGWTVIDYNYILPLTLEAIADCEITVSNPKSGMQYSVNGGAKTAVTTDPISVSTNDVVEFYGNGKEITTYDGTNIQCSANCYIYGNIMSLVDETGFVTNTTLTGERTFSGLFLENTHIKNHSYKNLVLPATTLQYFCYSIMFQGCTGLTKAPELPATTLQYFCYDSMFYGCTSLTKAPVLPATTLTEGCYFWMFQGCTNLNYVKCLATDISAQYCTYQWLKGVATTGTFVKAENTAWAAGISGIPCGWTTNGFGKQDILPLTLEAIADGTITISHPQTGMKYSLNRSPKRTASDSDVTIDVSKGDVVEFYGNGTEITAYYGTKGNYGTQIQCSADCYIYGNIMSLVDETGFVTNKTLTGERTFSGLFENNTHLKNHSDKELVMPATTLTYGCYSNMFWGCTGLTKAPELPATTLQPYCYGSMFTGCTGLTKAPELPATTLQPYCYIEMFADCTGLTTAPALPATTLQPSCYNYMFIGCTNLNNVKCLATNISAQYCTYGWIYNTAETGTFVKAANSTWTTGPDGIPSGWTVVEALSDNANNADGITALADNQSHDIMLYGRTIYRDGDWNTLCLPFDVDNLKGTPLEGATVMELDVETSNLKDGTLTLNFMGAKSIKAGKPYIVKWETPAADISNPLFEKVTVDASASTSVAFDGGSFIGSYSPVALPVNDTSNLFLGTSNTLYWPNGANNEDGNYYLNACRAYFHVDDVAAVREFVLNFDEGETTGIESMHNSECIMHNKADAWYSLDGRKLDGKPSAKGLYIYKGRKVAIK